MSKNQVKNLFGRDAVEKQNDFWGVNQRQSGMDRLQRESYVEYRPNNRQIVDMALADPLKTTVIVRRWLTE